VTPESSHQKAMIFCLCFNVPLPLRWWQTNQNMLARSNKAYWEKGCKKREYQNKKCAA